MAQKGTFEQAPRTYQRELGERIFADMTMSSAAPALHQTSPCRPPCLPEPCLHAAPGAEVCRPVLLS